MDEFLRQNYSLLTHGVEIFAAIVGLLYLKKYKDTNARYFIYFLVYVALLELIGAYPGYLTDYEFLSDIREFLKCTKFEKNYWWYTIFWNLGSAMFYVFYFIKVLNTVKYKNIIKVFSVIFLVISISFIFYNWDAFFIKSFPFISVFSGLVILLIVILYFIETLKSNRIVDFYRTLNFYIAAPMLIWCLVLTPISFFNIYFNTSDWNFIFLKFQLYLFTNMFLYLTFAFGLIFSKPENKK